MSVKGVYPLPASEGDRVRVLNVRDHHGQEGTFMLCWMGVEEVWDVELDSGTTIHVHPCLGETMEKV